MSTPQPCDPEIFRKGRGVCVVTGPSNAIEKWVRSIALNADARVDWHFSGGRGNVLHLGDDASRQRVLAAIKDNPPVDPVDLLDTGGPALPRIIVV